MQINTKSEITPELVILLQAFKQQLPLTVAEIKKNWDALFEGNTSGSDIKALHSIVIGLADSAGTYSASEVSKIAREIELELKPLINTDAISENKLKKLEYCFELLEQAAEDWLSLDISFIETEETNLIRDERRVYLLASDDISTSELLMNLEDVYIKVRKFDSLNEIKVFSEKELPVSIIVDESSGLDAVRQLKDELEICPPIIFVSQQDTTELRLQAVRAGVTRYFSKPLQIENLIHSINVVNKPLEKLPCRVLLIDNDKPLLECYAAILNDSGMIVEALSNPLHGLKVLAEFKPDVIIVDVYMPECSGPELVKMIRLDDKWSFIPIVFLSAEQDVDNQLHAMKLGADDFIVKPVKANKFIATIDTVVKRARKNIKLNRDLKNALTENRFQLNTLEQHAYISITDVNGRITRVNEKICEVTGYSREELIGKNHRIFKSEYHPDSFYDEMWSTISNGKIWHGTVSNLKKNGDEIWFDTTIVPFLDGEGNPYKYVSARTNITEYRQSEERLVRSQEFANISTWDWNLETNSLYCSKGLYELFGVEKQNNTLTPDDFKSVIHPNDRILVEEALNCSFNDGDEYNIEHRVIWPDDSIHWVHAHGDIVRNKEGKSVRMLGVVQDITNRKIAEQALIYAREEAENANSAKSMFLSNMSHELRTPMNAIMGFSQLLKMEKDYPLAESQLDNVNEIISASHHLMSLIDEVLDLAKIEAGHIELTMENILLGKVIAESLQLIMPLAQKRGIEIIILQNNSEISIDSLLKQNIVARADFSRLKQVLINLLSNAVKYNIENGKITIHCSYSNDNQVQISIADTGQGLEQQQKEKLFTAFNRLGAEQTEVEGTGIGLVISKKIIELMGGQIFVESHPGVGSTFLINLNCEARQLNDNGISNNYDDSQFSDELFFIDLKNKLSVLYIEDNLANMRLVTNLLERLPNLHMWSASEAVSGIEIAKKHRPDLILLDINLPEMNGFEVLECLRDNDITREIPVVAISANAMPADIQKGMDAGFDNYVVKPIDITIFLQVVCKELAKNISNTK